MTYRLFIDDERDPLNAASWMGVYHEMYRTGEWVIARNWEEVLELLMTLGMPKLISFDHDLGEGQLNGYEIAIKIGNLVMDGAVLLPNDFMFLIHSKNPVGAENIRYYMNQLIRFYEV